MQEKKQVGDVLNTLNFTNQQVADFCQVSESMIRKVRNGTKNPGLALAEKIKEFVQIKMTMVAQMLTDDGE